MGFAILWFLAVMIVLTVPAGVLVTVYGLRNPTNLDSLFSVVFGLLLSAAAVSVILQFGPAFVVVMF